MMDTTNDKFKRFMAMTDHPEDFSDEELMELVRDPEMAAWYHTLSDVEEAAKSKVHTIRVRGSRYHTLIISLLATAAAVILAFLLWPEGNSHLLTSPMGEGSGHLRERAEAKTQQPTVEMTEGQAMKAVATQQPAPASTPPMTATKRPPQARKHIAKAVKPAESLPQAQPQVQSLSNEGSMADDDAKAQLCSAEIELELAVHQRQAAYEREMTRRSLELLMYIMEQEDEEMPTGGVRTQKS